jgi:hypothetical protein
MVVSYDDRVELSHPSRQELLAKVRSTVDQEPRVSTLNQDR